MSTPETPKHCGVCGGVLEPHRVFARPDSWVCVKAGCPAWRWDGEPAPKAEAPPCDCFSRILDDGLPATSHRTSCPKHPWQAEAPPAPKRLDDCGSQGHVYSGGECVYCDARKPAREIRIRNGVVEERVPAPPAPKSEPSKLAFIPQRLALSRAFHVLKAQNAELRTELERLRDLIVAEACNDGPDTECITIPHADKICAEARAIRAAREAGKGR